jgi:hypothetical protein
MKERDMFHMLKLLLTKMWELQKENPRIKDTSFIEPEEEEKMENEKNHDHHEIRKEQQENMKNILADATRVHELLSTCFYQAHLKEKSNL